MVSEDFHELGPGSNNIVHTLYMKLPNNPDQENAEQVQKVSFTFNQLASVKIDPTYKVVMYYNMSCCYQRLQLYDECAEYLEKATQSLKERIKILDQYEQNFLHGKIKPTQNQTQAIHVGSGPQLESFGEKSFNMNQRYETAGNTSSCENAAEPSQYPTNGRLLGSAPNGLNNLMSSRSKTRQNQTDGSGFHTLT